MLFRSFGKPGAAGGDEHDTVAGGQPQGALQKAQQGLQENSVAIVRAKPLSLLRPLLSETSDDEQDITNAIIKAIEGQQKKVYFVQGHGEKDPTSADEREGYNTISAALGRDNYQVEKLVLAQQGVEIE